jgi:hypothetical protein
VCRKPCLECGKVLISPGLHVEGALNGWNCFRRNVFLSLCLLLIGCRWHGPDSQPAIEFTKIPPASEGGPDKLEMIEGRAVHAHPGQRIVIFAKSGVWWIQPLDTQPFTKIADDSTWKSATHLGNQYAALLVEPSYQPPLTTKVLPGKGDGVVAVASVSAGKPFTPTVQTLKFSGYEWRIRHIASDRNGGISFYDPANVEIDSHGYLHLRITRQPDHLMCSQVFLGRSLGYGTYVFRVQDVSHFEPAAALSLLTWDDLDAGQHHREMDIELSKWGDPKGQNGDYVIQPYYFPENKVRFVAPAGELEFSLQWESGKASFQTVRYGANGQSRENVATKVFTTGVPSPGTESIYIDFCDFKSSRIPLRNEAEVVLERFQYLP